MPLLRLLYMAQAALAVIVDGFMNCLDQTDDTGLPVHGVQAQVSQQCAACASAVHGHCNMGDSHAMGVWVQNGQQRNAMISSSVSSWH